MEAASKIKAKHDGQLTLAVGSSRFETNWKNKQMLWSELVKRLSQTTRTGETYLEYKKLSKAQQDKIKDVGGFVGGTLQGGRRKTESVKWRQLVTLDADHLKQVDLWGSIELLYDNAIVAYSTHKHEASAQRLRLVIPLQRPVTPDEYQAISRKIADDFGIDYFDDTTYQPHRLMYWPSTASDGEYVFKYMDGPWLDPDMVLSRYEDWRDVSYWPESSRQQAARKKMADKQGDPHEKPGLVGAFCRTYSVVDVLETLLADVYEPTGDGRYTYKEGSTTGGLVLYDDDKFVYSHHGTDPLSGQLANAFDLVRIHKFGMQDEDAAPGTPVVRLPSYTAMIDFAQKDANVRRQLGEERLAEASEEFGELPDDADYSWMEKLDVKKNGDVLSTAHNIMLILQNDQRLAGKIAYNKFNYRPAVLGDLPWRPLADGDTWQDRDDASLRNYLESVYNISGQGKIFDALTEVQQKNAFHPVRDYLDSLEWDGVARLDTLFIDYLGAEDSAYVRAVSRKMFTAAVARIYQPGCKFDNILVLVGKQGVGKSYIIKKLGQGWHSDSLSTVTGKEAYEQLQGAWLIEMAELSATRKAEAEAVKHFISKQEDSYRVAYGRQTSVFPRQCVFFGTTNDSTFLKDKTGNRRFWPVVVHKKVPAKSLWTDMDQNEINQIWAEAVHFYQEKEPLYLGKELEKEAQKVQESHTEESERTGMVQEFLERRLPADWDSRDIAERRMFIHGSDFGEQDEGEIPREKVCTMEVWVELFQSDPKHLTPMMSREINDILRRMPGWEPAGRLRFGKLYGTQRAFIRKN